MSYVLGLLIILLMMMVVGVSMEIITGIVLGIVILVNTLLLLFFVGCTVVLAGSEQKKAVFSRIEMRTESGGNFGSDGKGGSGGKPKRAKFDRACYIIEGREFPNAFPCEIMLRDRLYREDREVTVWLCEKQGVVFDRNAFTAALVGFFFFAAVCCGIGIMLIGM
ncbi:MAG: hypothetical protein NC078_01795 [Ruminococcus sp.]|nr:hypothetical protein [Ruminococcus sp.]